MVIRNTPKDPSKYIAVKSRIVNNYLQTMGYFPEYVDNNNVYYKKSGMLESFLNIFKKGGAQFT